MVHRIHLLDRRHRVLLQEVHLEVLHLVARVHQDQAADRQDVKKLPNASQIDWHLYKNQFK